MLAKKTSKNQITLPKKIVQKFSNVNYFDVYIEDNKIILQPVEIKPTNRLASIRQKIRKAGITEKDIIEAVKWARSQKG